MGATLMSMQTIFFGSGPVAAKSLQLLSSKFPIEAIITKPTTANDMRSINQHTPLYVVSNKDELDELILNTPFKSQYALLVDFGIIVSKKVIAHFPLGIINSHFSLLPEWRGADPITFSILSGQQTTGISLMLLTEGMDEGPLLAQASYKIPPHATTAILTDALIELSDATLKTVIPAYLRSELVPIPQNAGGVPEDNRPTYSRKLTKEDGIINWAKPAIQLEREIRAYSTWPKSHTTMANKAMIITQASVSNSQGKPGKIIATNKQLFVCCGQNSLEIERLKPAGKSDMSAREFLNGYRVLL